MGKPRGVAEFEAWRKDKTALTRSQAMLAFCADCMNLYQDEIRDCKNERCPLYPFQPYNSYSKKGVKV